jgi:hypothetical protein
MGIQPIPFHISARTTAFVTLPLKSLAPPTAMHSVADKHDTLDSEPVFIPVGRPVGRIVQPSPSATLGINAVAITSGVAAVQQRLTAAKTGLNCGLLQRSLLARRSIWKIEPSCMWHVALLADLSCGSVDTTGSIAEEADHQTTWLIAVQRGLALGNPRVCSTGTWTGNPTSFAHAWYCTGTLLTGFTGPTYTLGMRDDGTTFTCVVTASNASGAGTLADPTRLVPWRVLSGGWSALTSLWTTRRRRSSHALPSACTSSPARSHDRCYRARSMTSIPTHAMSYSYWTTFPVRSRARSSAASRLGPARRSR